MRAAFLAALLLAAASCRRAPSSTVAYSDPGGRFTATLPAAWTVDERAHQETLVTFFGPGKGSEAETLAVSYLRPDRFSTPRAYLYWRATQGRSRLSGNEAIVELRGPRVLRLRAVAVPAPGGGIFALDDYTELDRAQDDGALDAFVASFKPAAR